MHNHNNKRLKKGFFMLLDKYVSKYSLMFVLAMIMSATIGCSYVKPVSVYDEQMDKGITILQKHTEEVLLMIETYQGKAESTYEYHRAYYKQAAITVSSLKIRSEAIQENNISTKMLDNLLNNIKRFEQDHVEGITASEINLYRGGFNSQFTALLSLELAKKRL
jgi:hypothetical protein